MTKDADAFGQNNAVESVLQIVVIRPHVQLAEGILNDIRGLQQHLIELNILAAGDCGNRRTIECNPMRLSGSRFRKRRHLAAAR